MQKPASECYIIERFIETNRATVCILCSTWCGLAMSNWNVLLGQNLRHSLNEGHPLSDLCCFPADEILAATDSIWC